MALKWTAVPGKPGEIRTSDGYGGLIVRYDRRSKKYWLYRDKFGQDLQTLGGFDSRVAAQKAAEPMTGNNPGPRHPRKGSVRELVESLRDPAKPWLHDSVWLKLSNQALRAFPGSPRQKEFQQKMLERQRELMSNPGPRHHSAKWDRCVKEVKARGSAVSPYAVCTAALNEIGRNPMPRDPEHRQLTQQLIRHFRADEASLQALKPYYVVSATRGRITLWLDKKRKFQRREMGAERFTGKDAKPRAVGAARAMIRRFPQFESWRVDIRQGFLPRKR